MGKLKKHSLLLASTILVGAATFASCALAQDATATSDKKADDKTSTTATEVVVTGSRIRKTEYTSPSPVEVITSETTTLLGEADPAKIIQGSPVAATASQINNNYTGYLTTGGPGVNTVSLRGLGANRTLILINGHRVGPAGVRGTVGPVDLNTIPGSLIDRVEVLKDGASSIYGSDAVAGVVNIITKKNYSGGDIKLYASIPQHHGGAEYNFSMTQGYVSDRLHMSIGADYYSQEAMNMGDRDWSKCPQDFVYNSNGSRADLIDPATGTYKCTITTERRVDNLSTGRYYVYDSSAVKGGGYAGDDLNGLHRVSATYANNSANTLASRGEAPVYNTKLLDRNIISPVTRKTFSLFGGYDLTDTTELYWEAMVNERDSSQHTWRQLFPTISPYNPNNIFRVGNPNGYPAGYARPIITVPYDNDQQVNYKRVLIGLKGHLPDYGSLKNWTWDLSAQTSISDGTYGNNFIYNDRVLATTGAKACDTSLLTTATSCPTGGIQWFRPSTVNTGIFSPEESAFLFGYEQGHTNYHQSYIEADFSGDLFTLPAGVVGGAFGFMLRGEKINDQPGPQAAASNSWGLTTATATRGSDTLKEAYAEIDIPVLKDFPLVKKLDVSASTRYSDYKSYGSDSTYKIGINWALTSTVRVRASQGNSFRAPSLYELYLGDQTGFLSQSTIDPCYSIESQSSPSATVVANCAAQGIPTNYTAAGSGSALVYSGGGKGILKAETSDNKGLGIVWTPHFANMQVALDYYETKVNNEVSKFGSANILYQCYNSPNLSSPFCSLFTRDLTPGSTTLYNIITVHDNYLNVAEEWQRGYNLSFNYKHNFGFMKLEVTSQNQFVTDWTYTLLNGSAPQNELGYTGYPHYAGNIDFRIDKGDYTFMWGMDVVGPTNDKGYYGTDLISNYSGVTGNTVRAERSTKLYAAHTVSLRKSFDKWAVIGTISNLFDQDPPTVSTGAYSGRLGNAPLTSQYDQIGRAFRLTLQRKW